MISELQKNDNIDKIAHLIYITAIDLFDMLFSRKKAISSLTHLIIEQGNMFSFEYVTVYKENDIIAGVIVGHSGKDKKLIRMKERKVFIKAIGYFRAFHYFVMMKPVLRWLMKFDLKENEFYISNIGVDEKYRGKGIGTQLIKHIISEQQRKGTGKVYLDVEANNTNAKRLYESMGFKIEKKRTIGLFDKKVIVLTMYLSV